MPRYEYRCAENDRVVEVEHGMSEELKTWGQVCERAGIDPGGTPRSAGVEKIISLSFVGRSSSSEVCERGEMCCRGACRAG
ncbi:MAG: zinc ribbon domain-containing protein [Planctomycetota bacterium]|nr:MAG: zinc ribbon domain-containing protein [Planctomycetota bacterium]